MEDIMKFENYTEEERDNGLDSKGKPISGADRYPELAYVARQISKDVIAKINTEADKVESKMPYKSQFILEELIKILEELV
jgi:hypothetical protein